MKNTLFLLLACFFFSTISKAQNGWYLMAAGSMGSSGIKQGSMWPEEYISNITGFNAQARVGYHHKKWRIETGLQYNVTGYKQGLIFGSSFPDTLPTGSLKTTFRELSVPLQVGYEIPVSGKLSIVPYLGITTGLCLGSYYTTKLPDTTVISGKSDSKSFDYVYHKVNVWGSATIHAEYKLSSRWGIIAGPSFQYMLNNMMKRSASLIPESNSVQHNYLLAFDLGLKMNI
jgi:hypothetical protein